MKHTEFKNTTATNTIRSGMPMVIITAAVITALFMMIAKL
jgi:hypothetical protein